MKLGRDFYNNSDKIFFLDTARKKIETHLDPNSSLPDFTSLDSKFFEIRSCFVTLHTLEHNLRGCIGNIQPFEPLIDNVLNNAYNAAFKDPRFPPISSIYELNNISIEISILSVPVKIDSYKLFEPGKHGIILEKLGSTSVFLPQVATEQNWNAETTLNHLALKAGLDINAWKNDGCNFKVFEAQYFSEI